MALPNLLQRHQEACVQLLAQLISILIFPALALISMLTLAGVCSLLTSDGSVQGRTRTPAQLTGQVLVFVAIQAYLSCGLPLIMLASLSWAMRLQAASGLEVAYRRSARSRMQFINGLRMVPPFLRRRWQYLIVVAVVFLLAAVQFDEDMAFVALGVMNFVNCILAFVVDMVLGVRSLSDAGAPMPPEVLQHAMVCAETYISVLMDGATLSNGGDDCSVCMEPLGKDVCAMVSCGHVFHARCLRLQVAHALLAHEQRGNQSDALPLCALCRAPIAAFGPSPQLALLNVQAVPMPSDTSDIV